MSDSGDKPIRVFDQFAAEREQLLGSFEEAWRDGKAPAIVDYLKGDGEARRHLLAELVHAELEFRLKSGDAARVEEYLTRYPELTHDTDCLVSLIAAEYRLRGRQDSSLGIDQYLARFPAYRERLIALTNIMATRDEQEHSDHCMQDVTTDPTALDTPDGPGSKRSASESPPRPARIGRYRVSRAIGRGGFGLVYLAHDDELDRPVAIKVPHAKQIADRQGAAPYLAEARAAAHLEHPNIVPVYDVGSCDEIPFYMVSKFIAGQSLQQRGQGAPCSHERSAELIAKLADALHHAHKLGVVHRDIKPGNILVEDTGKPFLVDFGLALREADYGRSGRHAGTPAYMSPEQARGEGHRVDGRSDIFSLGIVFYELLVNRHPFRGGSPAQWIEQIKSVDPRPPRQIDDSISKELERICLKALSKRAVDRYTTAKDMADDLCFFLAEREKAAQTVGRQSTSINGTSATANTSNLPVDVAQVRIVPKGLRSFDEHDADFFLELLPGPRDRQGLPESIRFWKTRIEERTAEMTFPVSLLYGPSGCGKSSLVKAGLLPRLADHVRPVFVEATPHETESRLLARVRRLYPALPGDLSLQQTFAALRRGDGIPNDWKTLVVLDQFEQWLHAQNGQEHTELTAALRQCDGGRLQALIMVRDDFWVPATRFMQELEVRVVEGHNAALIDLFDTLHARKVLEEYGKAYGRLPVDSAYMSPDLHAFLDATVQGLAQCGKVICVRLALLAEMLKGRAWDLATLTQVGGAEGLGVTFLEETFCSASAPAAHRYHQEAAQAVLSALLPPATTNIRGNRQPSEVLRATSGYAERPSDFADLIHILDKEVRLITPAVGDEEDIDAAARQIPKAGPSPQNYQLTHDYLVPSLRDWLTRKQRDTRRGRAALRLTERTAQWSAKPENRHLPSLVEFINISLWTRRRDWNEAQRKVMKKAQRFHSSRAAMTIITLAMLAWGVFESYGRIQVQNLLTTDAANLPIAVGRLSPWQLWARSQLQVIIEEGPSDDEPQRELHARLARAALTHTYDPELAAKVFECPIPYLGVIREVLQPHRELVAESLWTTLEDATQNDDRRLRAGIVLSSCATDSNQWSDKEYALLARQLVWATRDDQPVLLDDLQPIAPKLIPELEKLFVDDTLSESQQESAAKAIVRFAGADVASLARLLPTASPTQFSVLYPVVSQRRGKTSEDLLAQIAAKAPAGGLTDSERVAMGRRRAGAAISLVQMGDVKRSLDVFRSQDDPEALTQFVHRARDRGVTPKQLLELLASTTEANVRFAVLLTLGDFALAEVEQDKQSALIPQLTEWYRNDPSAAIHGATGWLLRKWGFEKEVTQVDHTPVPYDPTGTRQWFVLEINAKPGRPRNYIPVRAVTGRLYKDTRIYFTFVVFPKGEFLMGDTARNTPDRLRKVQLTKPLAVSIHEVTWEQYDPIDHGWHHFLMDALNHEEFPDHAPVTGVTWFDSVRYCLALTQQAGFDESDQCYDNPSLSAQDGDGDPQAWTIRLGRRGFRLLTETEWEYACRSGTRTTFSFGSDDRLLEHYGWYLRSPGEHWPRCAGQLRPNLQGMFDMHGNVIEWCHDWGGVSTTDVDPTGTPIGTRKVVRGGNFMELPDNVKSARQLDGNPSVSSHNLGFRIAMFPTPGPASLPARTQ